MNSAYGLDGGAMGEIADRIKRYDEQHSFLRQYSLPEEDVPVRYRKASGYRWFRSANVVCLEKARLEPEHPIARAG
jgi:hypothetical protein